MSSGRFPCFSFRPPQRAQEGESSLSKEREQRPKSGPYPMGGAGTLPSRNRATQRPTGGHAGLSCSRRRLATRWRSVANSNSSSWRA